MSTSTLLYCVVICVGAFRVGVSFQVCGNYCGPHWCNGQDIGEGACDETSEPTSPADACCLHHDKCCGQESNQSSCNRLLVKCLSALQDDDLSCERPPLWPFAPPMTVSPPLIKAGMTLVQDWCCGQPCDGQTHSHGTHPNGEFANRALRGSDLASNDAGRKDHSANDAHQSIADMFGKLSAALAASASDGGSSGFGGPGVPVRDRDGAYHVPLFGGAMASPASPKTRMHRQQDLDATSVDMQLSQRWSSVDSNATDQEAGAPTASAAAPSGGRGASSLLARAGGAEAAAAAALCGLLVAGLLAVSRCRWRPEYPAGYVSLEEE